MERKDEGGRMKDESPRPERLFGLRTFGLSFDLSPLDARLAAHPFDFGVDLRLRAGKALGELFAVGIDINYRHGLLSHNLTPFQSARIGGKPAYALGDMGCAGCLPT